MASMPGFVFSKDGKGLLQRRGDNTMAEEGVGLGMEKHGFYQQHHHPTNSQLCFPTYLMKIYLVLGQGTMQ